MERCAHTQELKRLRAEVAVLTETVRLQAQTLAALAPRPSRRAALQRHSVILEEGENRKRELATERQRTCRARKRSVTAQRDSVTASVTLEEEKKERISSSPPPLPPPSASEQKGALTVVTVAARDSVRDRPRDTPQEHRTPATLPAEVQALRAAWNELVAPHGFPAWGERTSARLLDDAQAALEHRSLEEWRKAFALIPRAPVCRGELGSRQRASLVWMLVGRTREGYEPAECLLTGRWSLDPEPGKEVPSDAGSPTRSGRAESMAERLRADVAAAVEREQEERRASESRLEMLASDDSPPGRAWSAVLEAVRHSGKTYALQWLTRMRAAGIEDEGLLLLECPDRFFQDWVDDHYRALVELHLSSQGISGFRYVLPERAGGAP